MPKSNDFQILIEWMYLPSFRWIDKIPFKLSSGKLPHRKKTFLVMWPLWFVEMSLQHIQRNSPRLLHKPAKFEKNPPNGYRVIWRIKCGAGGAAGGAWRSPIHKQASLAGRLIPKEALTMMNISCKFGKCTLHALWYGAAKVPKYLNETAVAAILFLETRPKKVGGKLLYHWTYPTNLRPLLLILLAAEG